MDRTIENKCHRCGEPVKLVTAMAPTNNAPGIIAWECPSCGKADSTLVYPMRGRSHASYEAMLRNRS